MPKGIKPAPQNQGPSTKNVGKPKKVKAPRIAELVPLEEEEFKDWMTPEESAAANRYNQKIQADKKLGIWKDYKMPSYRATPPPNINPFEQLPNTQLKLPLIGGSAKTARTVFTTGQTLEVPETLYQPRSNPNQMDLWPKAELPKKSGPRPLKSKPPAPPPKSTKPPAIVKPAPSKGVAATPPSAPKIKPTQPVAISSPSQETKSPRSTSTQRVKPPKPKAPDPNAGARRPGTSAKPRAVPRKRPSQMGLPLKGGKSGTYSGPPPVETRAPIQGPSSQMDMFKDPTIRANRGGLPKMGGLAKPRGGRMGAIVGAATAIGLAAGAYLGWKNEESKPAPYSPKGPSTRRRGTTPSVAKPSKPTSFVKTKGGDYPVYSKGSAEAQSFRDAFKAAKEGSTFNWNGRSYLRKTKR